MTYRVTNDVIEGNSMYLRLVNVVVILFSKFRFGNIFFYKKSNAYSFQCDLIHVLKWNWSRAPVNEWKCFGVQKAFQNRNTEEIGK